MIAFSPGVAQGCFELLDIVSRHQLTFPQIRGSFAYLGGLTIEKIVEAVQTLNWLRSNEQGIVALTPTGSRLLSISGYEATLRQALLDYIVIESPPWIQNAIYGRSRVLVFAGNDIAQVFVEAGLVSSTDEGVVAFWDTLAARARGLQRDRLSTIGRQGERLTIAHERARTGRAPKWIAVENNADGYDVLSIVAADDARQLSIEVKTSTMGLAGSFHLSRNEWDRSIEVDNHAFHLWAIPSTDRLLLAVISPQELAVHVPKDTGEGRWEAVQIPLSSFAERFQPAEAP